MEISRQEAPITGGTLASPDGLLIDQGQDIYYILRKSGFHFDEVENGFYDDWTDVRLMDIPFPLGLGTPFKGMEYKPNKVYYPPLPEPAAAGAGAGGGYSGQGRGGNSGQGRCGNSGQGRGGNSGQGRGGNSGQGRGGYSGKGRCGNSGQCRGGGNSTHRKRETLEQIKAKRNAVRREADQQSCWFRRTGN
jgi:hypothetical protein